MSDVREPPCICGPDHTGESIDENPDCPQHGHYPIEPDYAHCRWFMTRELTDFFRQTCSMGCVDEPACMTSFEPDDDVDPPYRVSFSEDGKSARWLLEQGGWSQAGEASSLPKAREAARAVMWERIDNVFPF